MGESDEPPRTNAALRLLQLLKRAKGGDPKLETGQTWVGLLRARRPGEFMRRYAEVLRMAELVEEGIKQIDGINQELYLRWMPQADKLFASMNFEEPWSNSSGYITSGLIEGLEFCHDQLSRTTREPEIKDDELKKILTATSSLFNEVSESDITPELKQFILRHLYTIEKAIEDYQIIGSAPLKSARANMVADILYDSSKAVPACKTEPGKRLWKIMTHISVVLGVYSGTPQLGNDVIQILSPSPEAKQALDAEPAHEGTPLLDSDKDPENDATSAGESDQA